MTYGGDLKRELGRAVHELAPLARRALKRFLRESCTMIVLTIEGAPMTNGTTNYQLTAGDSVVVTITDTDDVTGEVVTPDAGSVSASLSSPTDTVVVDPSGAFATITAGDTPSTVNTITVSASVGGVPSAPGVGTYDVVAPAPDATSVALSFGAETVPTDAAAAGASAAPAQVFDQTTGNYKAAS